MSSGDHEEKPVTAVAYAGTDIPERSEWTVDDLKDLPKDFRYELVNGRLIVPSPTAMHQDIAHRVKSALEEHCPDGYVVSTDQSLAIDVKNEPRPDVVVMPAEHFDVSPVPVAGSLLVVEVISATQTVREMVDKARAYSSAKIGHYWIIDPLREQIELIEMILDDAGRGYDYGEATAGVFRTQQPFPVVLDLPALSKRHAAIRGRKSS